MLEVSSGGLPGELYGNVHLISCLLFPQTNKTLEGAEAPPTKEEVDYEASEPTVPPESEKAEKETAK